MPALGLRFASGCAPGQAINDPDQAARLNHEGSLGTRTCQRSIGVTAGCLGLCNRLKLR
jgi:hypothetical protein